jgi:hypothetical protein
VSAAATGRGDPADGAASPELPPSSASRHLGVWLGGALVLLAVAVYLPTLRHGFVDFDDPDWVAANPRVHEGLTAVAVAWALRADVLGHRAPLTLISHLAAWELFGDDPAGHHPSGCASPTPSSPARPI